MTQIQPLIVDLSNQPYHFSVSSLFSPTELTFSSGTFLTAYIILLNIHVLTHTHTLILPSLSPHFSVLCYREMQKKKKKTLRTPVTFFSSTPSIALSLISLQSGFQSHPMKTLTSQSAVTLLCSIYGLQSLPL